MRNALALALVIAALPAAVGARVQDDAPPPPIIGRWDMTMNPGQIGRSYPSWLEVSRSGFATLVGRFVGGGGSARPISQVVWEGGRFHFTIPVQWEAKTGDMTFDGQVEGDRLTGTVTGPRGADKSEWAAVRAPRLFRERAPKWGTSVVLFNGRDLAGWHLRHARAKNGWTVRDGVLVNAQPGNDLVSDRKFTDFKVHAEFRYPANSNSGLYLRGRYEAQIEDSFGSDPDGPAGEPDSHGPGGIYGFLTPRVNAAKHPGEWQTYDITLVGREVTVVYNGQEVICRRAIPGITGGALDSDEGAPGPIMIQGDHGQVEFRSVVVTPARD